MRYRTSTFCVDAGMCMRNFLYLTSFRRRPESSYSHARNRHITQMHDFCLHIRTTDPSSQRKLGSSDLQSGRRHWMIRFAHPFRAILRMFSALRATSSSLRRDDVRQEARNMTHAILSMHQTHSARIRPQFTLQASFSTRRDMFPAQKSSQIPGFPAITLQHALLEEPPSR